MQQGTWENKVTEQRWLLARLVRKMGFACLLLVFLCCFIIIEKFSALLGPFSQQSVKGIEQAEENNSSMEHLAVLVQCNKGLFLCIWMGDQLNTDYTHASKHSAPCCKRKPCVCFWDDPLNFQTKLLNPIKFVLWSLLWFFAVVVIIIIIINLRIFVRKAENRRKRRINFTFSSCRKLRWSLFPAVRSFSSCSRSCND